MSLIALKFSQIFIHFLVLFALICAIGSMTVTATGIAPAKVATILTIELLPDDPATNQSSHVSGVLTSSDGQRLGNKRINLESSLKESPDTIEYSSLDLTNTEQKGKYDFFLPADSPPEYIRANFTGNDEFEGSVSQVIAVRGIGTSHPQIPSNETGSIMVSSDPEEADILIDQVMYGVTPKKVGGLTKGTHILKLVKSGYQNETMEAYVTADRDVSFDITLNEADFTSRTGIIASTEFIPSFEPTDSNLSFSSEDDTSFITENIPGLMESDHLSFTKNVTGASKTPDINIDINSKSIEITGNSTQNPISNSLINNTTTMPQTHEFKTFKVSTIVMNNAPLGDGYDIMTILTDH